MTPLDNNAGGDHKRRQPVRQRPGGDQDSGHDSSGSREPTQVGELVPPLRPLPQQQAGGVVVA